MNGISFGCHVLQERYPTWLVYDGCNVEEAGPRIDVCGWFCMAKPNKLDDVSVANSLSCHDSGHRSGTRNAITQSHKIFDLHS